METPIESDQENFEKWAARALLAFGVVAAFGVLLALFSIAVKVNLSDEPAPADAVAAPYGTYLLKGKSGEKMLSAGEIRESLGGELPAGCQVNARETIECPCPAEDPCSNAPGAK